jgi:hypothetical protein
VRCQPVICASVFLTRVVASSRAGPREFARVARRRAPSARGLRVGLPHAGCDFLLRGTAGLRAGRGFLERNFTSSARRPPRAGSRGSWLPLAQDFTSNADSRGLPVRTTSRGRVCLPLLLLIVNSPLSRNRGFLLVHILFCAGGNCPF